VVIFSSFKRTVISKRVNSILTIFVILAVLEYYPVLSDHKFNKRRSFEISKKNIGELIELFLTSAFVKTFCFERVGIIVSI
jgi:hypothetical protein